MAGVNSGIMAGIMNAVNAGIIGLGNVGRGTIEILADNADQIVLKLGFRIQVKAVAARSLEGKTIPEKLGPVFTTTDWRKVVTHSEVDIVCELVGGTSVAAEI